MKSLRIVALAAFAVFCAAQARAGSIPPNDPKIVVGGGSGSTPVGIAFMFNCDNQCASDTFIFQNATQSTFLSLAIDVDGSISAPSCDVLPGGPFTGCGANPDSDGAIFTFSISSGDLPFSPCGSGSGVGPGCDFSVAVTGFPANQNFFAAANGANFPDVPEPATGALCLTGITLLTARWRRKQGRSRA